MTARTFYPTVSEAVLAREAKMASRLAAQTQPQDPDAPPPKPAAKRKPKRKAKAK